MEIKNKKIKMFLIFSFLLFSFQLVFAEPLASTFEKATAKETAGDYEGAQSLYEGILHHHPEHKDALYGVARTQYWQGKYESSIDSYEKILKIYPNESGAMVGLGKCHLALGHQNKAQEYFKKAEKADPKNEEVKDIPTTEEKAYIELEAGPILESSNFADSTQSEYQEIRYTKESRYGGGFHHSYRNRLGKEALYTGIFGNYYLTPETRTDLFLYFSPRAMIVPQWRLGGSVRHTFKEFLTPGVEYEFDKYKEAEFHLVSPSLKIHPLSWLGVTGKYQMEILKAGTRDFTNHSLFGELEISPSSSFTFHAGAGKLQKDFEGGRTVPVFAYNAITVFGGVKAIVMNSLLLRFDLAWEDRSNNENLTRYMIGLGYRF